ncbi:MAG: hypothetical protein U0527_05745 [Candidatus Eisenbacteria bacterium]
MVRRVDAGLNLLVALDVLLQEMNGAGGAADALSALGDELNSGQAAGYDWDLLLVRGSGLVPTPRAWSSRSGESAGSRRRGGTPSGPPDRSE